MDALAGLVMTKVLLDVVVLYVNARTGVNPT